MLSTAQLRGLSIGLHCLVCLSPSLPALAQSPPLLFQGLYSPNSGNTDLSSATDPGFNATPVLWHFDPMSNGIPSLRARNTYAWQARRTTINIPSAWRAFYAVQDAAVVAGGNPADAQDIANTLAWFSNQDATLDYVFDDFEGQGTAGDWSNIQNLVNQVRGSVAGANAGIGSYSKYYGSLDLSQPYPYQSDRRLDSRYYASGAANGASGLTVAMPACYPMQYLTNHADDTYSWGQSWWTQRTGFSSADQTTLAPSMTYNQRAATAAAYLSPNERAAMFYGPLESISAAKRDLPAGQQLIPWISAYQASPSFPALQPGEAPTQPDNEALLEHMRLRGADGFDVFGSDEDPGLTGSYSDGSTFYANSYHAYSADMAATWHSMDWFFALPTQVGAIGANGPLNLNTFKNTGGTYTDAGGRNGGIEWSAYQRGNRILAVISNLGNADQAATGGGSGNNGNWSSVIGALGSDLPAQSPTVPHGNHLVVQYLANAAEPDFGSYAANTVLGTAQGWHASATDFVISAPKGTGDTHREVVSIQNSAATAWFANSSTANPGGIGASTNDTMVYSFQVYTGWSGSGSAAFAPVVGSGSAVPVAAPQSGPTLWVYAGDGINYWAFGGNYSSGGPYHATNYPPSTNTWYDVELIVNPATNQATVYVLNLTTGGNWTLLLFDDTQTTSVENLTSVPAALVPSQEAPSLYNGYQLSGSAGAQFDAFAAELYPYPATPLSSYTQPLPSPAPPPGADSDTNDTDGPMPAWAILVMGGALLAVACSRLNRSAPRHPQ